MQLAVLALASRRAAYLPRMSAPTTSAPAIDDLDTEADGLASKMGVPDDVGALSIKELRKLIESARLTHTDCLEKSDLQKRAREAQQVLAAAPRDDVKWVTCPLCQKQFAARSEEECTAHMVECAAFAAKHGPGGTEPAGS